MPINYRAILDSHGIRYTTRQQSEGNIGVACPFCARTTDPDPSEHLGLNLATGAWNCWRNSNHRGNKPHRLLKALIGLSYADVDKLLGKRPAAPTSEFDAMFANGNNPFIAEPEMMSNNTLSEIAQQSFARFVPITAELASPHANYLRRRGVIPATAASEFGLMAGIVGRWAGRVIFPVKSPDGVSIATWTARSIGATQPKYLALSREHGANIKHLLYRVDRVARGGETIVVTEGPMDVVVLQQLAPATTITCTFGLSVSNEQIALLKTANFNRVVFLFDSTAYGNAQECAHRAGGEAIDYSTLFNRAGDPGDLTMSNVPVLREAGIK